jgi:hypothetical protein
MKKFFSFFRLRKPISLHDKVLAIYLRDLNSSKYDGKKARKKNPIGF